MIRILQFIPITCFGFILLFLTGWTWFNWHITTVLPYLIAFLDLFLASIAWQTSRTKWVKQTSTLLFLSALLFGVLLVLEVIPIKSIWAIFVLIGLSSIHLYLYELAKGSGIYTRNFKLILLLPLILTVSSVVGLYLWNGSLTIAWLSLILTILLSLVGVIAGYKRT